MKRPLQHLPLAVTLLLVAAALFHGPIHQPAGYHDFADQTLRFGVPHFCDVTSNLGFALAAFWGWVRLAPNDAHPALRHGWAGYRLFLIGLFLTALGSSWYHLAPDNASLVWDRLPIALACAGLLAGVLGDVRGRDSRGLVNWLALAAVASVAWWVFTDLSGQGDLRPYLLLQVLPILLIPLWQWLYKAPGADRLAFGAALAIYVLAKFAELYDHEIAAVLGPVTGHTLKHLLATGAAALIVGRLVGRLEGQMQPRLTACAAACPPVPPSATSACR
ncbi:MAG: alkaline phytoceramidase [Sulfuritalea sp.]|nr:alkaline phytoceramidase [Sulfuritalea sp.]MDP1985069.1 alkaline phytoceramidase [Sulfuritalea sp.]